MALRQADTRLIGQQWAVKKVRRLEFKRAVEQELARGGSEQVCAAHNFGDSHGRIVHHARKLVCRNVIMPPDDKIAEVLPGDKLLRTELSVREGNGFAVGHAETPVEAS